ncbi:MAG: hypothetical protein N2D54_02345 [Chloroflexota bacterium]
MTEQNQSSQDSPQDQPVPPPVQPRIFGMGPEEFATPVMVYFANRLVWGHMVTHLAIPAMRALVGTTLPDILTLHDAEMVSINNGQMGTPEKRNEIFIPTKEILGFHLKPPNQGKILFDETEQNRKMGSLTAFVGGFHFDAEVRIAKQTGLKNYIDVVKAEFLEIYNTQVTLPTSTVVKPVQTNIALVKRQGVFFSSRE